MALRVYSQELEHGKSGMHSDSFQFIWSLLTVVLEIIIMESII